MGIRECDLIDHLRFRQTMTPSNCKAVLKDGSRLEVLMHKGRPVVEIENQFFHAAAVSGFDRFELKPVAAPIPEQVVQLPDKPIKDEPVDTSGQRLRAQLLRNPDVIYKRNLLRQTVGNLEVKEYLGVGQSDSTTRFWYCYCKAHGRYIVATQAELVTETVTCCKNARAHTEKIEFRGAQLA